MPFGQAAHRRQHDARGRGGRGRWRASEARAREPRTCRYPGQPGASSEPTSRCHASSVSMRVWNDDIAVAARRAARHAAHGEWPPLAWQSLRPPSLSLAGACSARRARTHVRAPPQHAVGPTRCRGTGTRARHFSRARSAESYRTPCIPRALEAGAFRSTKRRSESKRKEVPKKRFSADFPL